MKYFTPKNQRISLATRLPNDRRCTFRERFLSALDSIIVYFIAIKMNILIDLLTDNA